MDIMAYGDGWAFGMMADGFKYAIDKKTGALSLVINEKSQFKRDFVHVTCPSGVFLETLDKDGKVIQEGGDGQFYYVQVGKCPVVLRRKELPDPHLTIAQLDENRQNVTRWLVDDQPYSVGVPDTLLGLISWAQGWLKKIPQQSRKNARCSFGTSSSYGETYPNVEVSYSEPETDKEVIARIKIDRERERANDNAEREQFRRLKGKFCAS